MGDVIEVRVPDIGDFEDVEVVELLVGPGDRVEADDSLVSIESDKATMEIPSPAAGVVETMHVALGDKVSEGTLLLSLSSATGAAASADPAPGGEGEDEGADEGAGAGAGEGEGEGEASAAEAAEAAEVEAAAGSAADAPVEAEADDAAGAVGATGAEAAAAARADGTRRREADAAGPAADRRPGEAPPREPPVPDEPPAQREGPHASPLVRRFARELGVDLSAAPARGPHGRVLEEDVKDYVRTTIGRREGPAAEPGGERVAWTDPAKFGPVHEEPLGRIRRVSARNLSQSWRAPHVTQHDEADVTELEAFRKSVAEQARERGVRLSPLHFAMKAVAIALAEFPDMRASLAPEGDALIVRDYLHLGIAVDTEHGLVVPVVRDVDRKGVFALAEELAGLAERARDRKLAPGDMQGAAFTISSLGGIGGTAFTPIVNAPEVGLLGLSKLSVRPVWSAGLDVGVSEGRFEPRIVLPLSLSYDHRVIDGAVAVRFTTRLVRLLAHPAHLLL